jgi:hypothetical protein
MKKIITVLSVLLAVSACSPKDQTGEQSTYATPQAAVTAFIKAMNTQDSSVMTGLLSKTTKEIVLTKIGEIGGFKKLFSMTHGIQMYATILGVDSATEKFTKVYANQRVGTDTTTLVKLDSIFFSAVHEDNSWRLLNLNGRPDEKKFTP